jgi:hypothetical protein
MKGVAGIESILMSFFITSLFHSDIVRHLMLKKHGLDVHLSLDGGFSPLSRSSPGPKGAAP